MNLEHHTNSQLMIRKRFFELWAPSNPMHLSNKLYAQHWKSVISIDLPKGTVFDKMLTSDMFGEELLIVHTTPTYEYLQVVYTDVREKYDTRVTKFYEPVFQTIKVSS